MLGSQSTATVNVTEADPAPVFEFDATYYPVNENGGSVTLNVIRSNDADFTVDVDYATADGSATSPMDYISNCGTLQFAPGEMSKTFSVNVNDDGLYSSPDKQFSAQLSNPTGGATLGVNTVATVALLEQDTAPVITLHSQYNANEDDGSLTVTIDRTGDATTPVTAHWATFDGSAHAGEEYTASSGTVTFNQGEFSKQVQVPLIDDNLYSNVPTTTFGIFIDSPTGGATLGTTSATVYLDETDPAPVLQFDAASYTVAENGGSASLTVTRANDAVNDVTVDYATADGSASAPADYTATSGTLVFPQGDMSQTITVPVFDNGLFGPDKAFSVSLSNPTGGSSIGTRDQASIDLTEADPAPVMQFDSGTYNVNEDAGTVTITVTRANDAVNSAAVDYTMSDGTALDGINYVKSSGQVFFNQGQMSTSFTVPVIDDGVVGNTVSFNISLTAAYSSPAGATIGPQGQATVVIHDVDTTPTVQFMYGGIAVNENNGSAFVTVTRTGNTILPVDVDYSMSDGTAISGTDYTAASGTLSFATGITSQDIEIPVFDDGLFINANKWFQVTLSAPVNATIDSPGTTTVNLVELDAAPVLQFNASAYSVAENGGLVTINVTRANDAVNDVTVEYATVDNTAAAGTDYSSTSGSLTFSQGVMSQTFTVPVMDDNIYGPDKSFTVTLSAPAGGAMLGTQDTATVDITEADAAPVIRMSSPACSADENGGTADIVVTRLNDAINSVTVQYNTSDGTAMAGMNYMDTNGTLTFNSGEMSKTLYVPIIDDNAFGPDLTFNMTLSNPAGGASIDVPNSITMVTIVESSSSITYHLKPGWNLIGVPLDVSDTSITGFFPSAVLSNMSTLWEWNATAQDWIFYGSDPNDWYYSQYPALANVKPGHGYWVEMNKSVDFSIQGTEYTGPGDVPSGNGWYLEGANYPAGNTPGASYPDAFTVWNWNATAQDWIFYGSDPNDWYYSQYPALTTLQPGNGTWIEMTGL